MTNPELIARQAKQIAELRASAKTITWPVVHHDVLSALLDAADENVRLREANAHWHTRALYWNAERNALRAENRRLNAIILAGGETLERQRVELAQNHEDWTALRAENAKLREALGMMSTAAPRTVVDSLRPIEWAIAVVEEVQAERDDRDKLRERIALLEDLCRKAVDPCVSYWMVVEPGIRTALACKETHND